VITYPDAPRPDIRDAERKALCSHAERGNVSQDSMIHLILNPEIRRIPIQTGSFLVTHLQLRNAMARQAPAWHIRVFRQAELVLPVRYQAGAW